MNCLAGIFRDDFLFIYTLSKFDLGTKDTKLKLFGIVSVE